MAGPMHPNAVAKQQRNLAAMLANPNWQNQDSGGYGGGGLAAGWGSGYPQASMYGSYMNYAGENAKANAALGASRNSLLGTLASLPYQVYQQVPGAYAQMYSADRGATAQENAAYYPAAAQVQTAHYDPWAQTQVARMGAMGQMNVAQLNNQAKLTGLSQMLGAIGPMLQQQGAGPGRGGFGTNYGAGVSW